MKITISIRGESGQWTERSYEDVPLDPEKALWFSEDYVRKFMYAVATHTRPGEVKEHEIKLRFEG